MAAPMEKTRHAGIYKRGSRYVAVWQDVRGLLSRGPPAILRLPLACLRWRGGWQGEVYALACIAERVSPTGQGA
jgi:hypothetical protein